MQARSLEAFGKELQSQSSCYAVVKNNATAPCTVVMHVVDVQVAPYHPAFVKLSNAAGSVVFSQIQSIQRKKDYYRIECGISKDNREIVYVYLREPDFPLLL